MKKLVPYLLLFIISFVYNYETIEYLSKAMQHAPVSHVDDFECEKEASGEKNEKNEKVDYLDDFISVHHLVFETSTFEVFHVMENHNFSSSDYSQVIYSPPEVA